MNKNARARSLTAAVEPLEQRRVMAADVLDVAAVLWNGQQVNAVRNEFVLRMPQTNAATAISVLDYACRTPVADPGWSVQSLGSGFFKLTAPGASQDTVTSWAAQQGVQSIDVNRISQASKTPNDAYYTDQNNWGFPRISADRAWDTGTGTATTIVAVLDSGIDYANADLAANMWRNPNEVAGNGIDDDRNGVVDDVFGFNAIANTGNPMDDFGHGTVVAGLIGAVGDDGRGMAGVNWSVRMMAVKVMDAVGNVPIGAEIAGINYVMAQKMAGQNIVAANCSFGRTNAFNQQEFDALTQLAATGITIVAAAGNNSSNNDVLPVFPANYSIDGLISVAASDQNDNLAPFSNFGRTTVDLTAPGVNILATRAAQANNAFYPIYRDAEHTVARFGITQNQAFVDGTSCSAAFVTGSVALLKSLKPAASTVQIQAAILNGVDRVNALNGLVVTGGRLNLANSVDLILATTGAFPVPTFVSGQALSVLEGNQGYTLVEIKVQLDRPNDPGKSCSVFYTTQPGGSAMANVDYVSTSGFITFSGKETQKSFFVRIIGDRQAEQREQFAVQILRARSTGIDPNTPIVQQLNPIILDDDYDTVPVQPGPTTPGSLPKVSVDVKRDTALTALPIYEGGVATFVVSLDRTSTKPVSVKYRTNQPSLVPANTALQGVDYLATSGTLTFNPGERTKEFTVRILADTVRNEGIDRNGDGDILDPGEGEAFHVVLTEPFNAEFDTATGGGGAANGVNTSSAVSANIIDATVPPSAPGFQMTLNYLGDVPAAIRGAAEWAAARWSQVITGDLPDVVDPQTGTRIDDLLVNVQVASIDGVGGYLAAASPDQFRTTGSRLPWLASATVDSADANNPLLRQILLHEFGHALGFTSEVFATKRLLDTSGFGFIGANALREYRTMFNLRNALNVPLETTGGAGTAGSHWSEDIFQTELMTGYVNGATTLPLSRVTVGAMADLGYTVNYVRADAFTKPRPATTTTSTPGTPLAAVRRLAGGLTGLQSGLASATGAKQAAFASRGRR